MTPEAHDEDAHQYSLYPWARIVIAAMWVLLVGIIGYVYIGSMGRVEANEKKIEKKEERITDLEVGRAGIKKDLEHLKEGQAEAKELIKEFIREQRIINAKIHTHD